MSLSPKAAAGCRVLRFGLCVLVVAGLLSACLPDSSSTKPGVTASRKAQQDLAAGRYERAARAFERLANTATGMQRDAYLLDASRAWFNQGASMKGLATLRKVRGPVPDNDPVINMLQVTSMLVASKPRQALQQLAAIEPTIDAAYQPAFLELRARAYAMTGNAEALVEALTMRETWIDDEAAIKQNRRLIWLSLRDLGRKGHALNAAENADANVTGWLNLARVYRDYRRNPAGLQQQVSGWREAHPQHMALSISNDLFGPGRDPLGYPTNLALLLPLNGPLSGAAVAIRDGFLSAYLNDNDNSQRPAIRLYDTSSRNAMQVYVDAINDGAQFVVGPLAKNSVAELAQAKASGATILALNYLPDDLPAPTNLFQFSLAPEHEAAESARRALADGLTRAVALVPDNDWGSRVLASFADEFAQGGGQLLDQQGYNPGEKDFGMPITQLLNLNSSKARHREISGIVGVNLEFEPRRRQDTQLVFLAANAEQGRLLRPQLNYHYANDLPVFSTSAIFDDDPSLNRKDLEGVIFADAPWMISDEPEVVAERQELARFWPTRMKRRARLYAMGIDAYQLIPLLHAQRQPLEAAWFGMTGVLTMEPGNRILRTLDVAIIKNGSAVYLPSELEVDDTAAAISPSPP